MKMSTALADIVWVDTFYISISLHDTWNWRLNVTTTHFFKTRFNLIKAYDDILYSLFEPTAYIIFYNMEILTLSKIKLF